MTQDQELIAQLHEDIRRHIEATVGRSGIVNATDARVIATSAAFLVGSLIEQAITRRAAPIA